MMRRPSSSNNLTAVSKRTSARSLENSILLPDRLRCSVRGCVPSASAMTFNWQQLSLTNAAMVCFTDPAKSVAGADASNAVGSRSLSALPRNRSNGLLRNSAGKTKPEYVPWRTSSVSNVSCEARVSWSGATSITPGCQPGPAASLTRSRIRSSAHCWASRLPEPVS